VLTRRNQISITGNLGSGKSTVGRGIAGAFGWKYISTGAVQREIAQKLGVSTLQLNKMAEQDRSIDEQIDRVFHGLQEVDGLVADSRMAWHFLPGSLRVQLYASPDVAAERIMNDNMRDAEKYPDKAIAIREITDRASSERKRFLHTYNVDILDPTNYHCVIDTSNIENQAVIDVICAVFLLHKNKVDMPKNWVSPKSLYPTRNVGHIANEAAEAGGKSVGETGFMVEKPPVVLRHDGQYFIVDGHRRISAALINAIALVPVTIVDEIARTGTKGLLPAEFLRDSVKSSLIHDWEEAHKLRFKAMPSWLD
jgi:cytidylate kinase